MEGANASTSAEWSGSAEVVATVDGVPLFESQVRQLIDEVDGGLPVDAALDVLIRNQLLAAEAKRRGVERLREIEDVRRTELARALLRTRIKQGVVPESLNEGDVRKIYEWKKKEFVHGILRRVVHVVALVGEKKFSEQEAKQLMVGAAQQVKSLETEQAFIEWGNTLKAQHPENVKVESLPPFAADEERLVRPFVEAVFSMSKSGKVSPAIKTKFGWHLIYFAQELPAENRSFSEVEDLLKSEILPYERIKETKHLFNAMDGRGNVHIYENVLDDRGAF